MFAVDLAIGYEPYRVQPAYEAVRLTTGMIYEVGKDGRPRVRDPRAVRRLGARIDIIAIDYFEARSTDGLDSRCGPGWCAYYTIKCKAGRTACDYQVAITPGPERQVYLRPARIVAVSVSARRKAEANVLLYSEPLKRPVASLSDLNPAG